VTVIWGFFSLVLAVLVAALGELLSDEIRARLDCVPLAALAAAARRLPADQRAELYEQAWLPELHHILRGDESKPVTRLVHGTHFAVSLWLAAGMIGREPEQAAPQLDGGIGVSPAGSLNLLALALADFEYLIRQLLRAMGLMVHESHVSRDGGVNAVFYDLHPLTGGTCVLQVKRYRHAVGLSAMYELAGTVESVGAVKGILITTGRVTAACQNFASRSGRIQLIDGPLLRAMLLEHLGLEVINSPPDL
jgi:hypothetical protein